MEWEVLGLEGKDRVEWEHQEELSVSKAKTRI